MGSHGPQFDEFTAQSGEHRGGALFDEHPGGPSAKAGTDAVTQTYRETTANGTGHGAKWDEFGWKQLPEHYGRHMDSDFRQVADIPHEHGTWQDIFRGGTEVRADVNGIASVEAVVIECNGDHAVLQLRRPRHADGGGLVEVNLGQIREWRAATAQGQASETRKPAASPGNTPARDKASSAQAPSATNRKARGGGRSDLETEAATGSVFTAVKTLREAAGLDVDVAKAAGKCGHCGLKTLAPITKPDSHATSMGATSHCTTCGSMHGAGGKMLGGGGQKTWWNAAKSGTRTAKTADADDVDVAKTLGELRKAAGLEA